MSNKYVTNSELTKNHLFKEEKITLEKVPALKQGKKWKVTESTQNTICEDLLQWRDGELLDRLLPGTTTISGATLLGNDVVETLAKCRE